MPQLIITETGKTEKRAIAIQDPEIVIGRQGDNAVVLVHEGISRHHAKIVHEGEEFFLIDLGSDNGTQLNNAPIKGHERYLLRTNDIIRISSYYLHFSRNTELEQSFNDITDSEILEVKLLKKVLHALDKETLPSLEVLNESAEGKKTFLTDDVDELTIGRDAETGFQIEEYVISRRHAAILRRDKAIVVKDLGSKNGTFVNGIRIQEAGLHDGDRLALGTVVCIFRNPQEVTVEAVKSTVAQAEKLKPQKKTKGKNAGLADDGQRTTNNEVKADDGRRTTDDDVEAAGDATEASADLVDMPEEEAAAREAAHAYPAPKARTSWLNRLSPIEMGLLWGSLLVFIITAVMLVKLVT